MFIKKISEFNFTEIGFIIIMKLLILIYSELSVYILCLFKIYL